MAIYINNPVGNKNKGQCHVISDLWGEEATRELSEFKARTGVRAEIKKAGTSGENIPVTGTDITRSILGGAEMVSLTLFTQTILKKTIGAPRHLQFRPVGT